MSSIRTEQRLFNHLINSKRKLELLKKSLEIEELREVQSKPKILNKSRILAEKAEQRLMEQHQQFENSPNQSMDKSDGLKASHGSRVPQVSHVMKISQIARVSQGPQVQQSNPFLQVPQVFTSQSSQLYPQVQPENSSRSLPRSKAPTPNPKPARFIKRGNKRTKSLLNLTVLERNEVWLEEKKSKLTKRKKEMEQKDMIECTFSPKTQNKLKPFKCFGPCSNTSFVSSPGTLPLEDLQEQNSRVINKSALYRQIAPYQVKISFKCGIDLNSFLKRAK